MVYKCLLNYVALGTLYGDCVGTVPTREWVNLGQVQFSYNYFSAHYSDSLARQDFAHKIVFAFSDQPEQDYSNLAN